MKIFTPRNYPRVLKDTLEDANIVTVGGQRTAEVINAHFKLKNPRDRIVVSEFRKMNLPFAVAEWLGLMTGEDHVDFFENFIHDYSKYSTDGVKVDGSYGGRLHAPKNQVAGVIEELKRDKFSRRAVITFYHGQTDLFGGGGVNTPCTLTQQFFIRDEKLHSVLNMRSNDAVLGFTYDVFMFTMLQEYIAINLGIELGNYYHNVGSFHVYERDWPLAEKEETARWWTTMKKMPKDTSSNIERLRSIYGNIKNLGNFWYELPYLTHPYWRNLACAALAFSFRKEQNEFAHSMLLYISDSTIAKVTKPWLL